MTRVGLVLVEVESGFQQTENVARIHSQEEILRLNDTVIADQRILNLLVGAIAVLFVLLAVIFFKLNRAKAKTNVTLDRKVRERTTALEASLNQLDLNQRNQIGLLKALSRDITSSIASINGLCNLEEQAGNNAKPDNASTNALRSIATRLNEIGLKLKRITGV